MYRCDRHLESRNSQNDETLEPGLVSVSSAYSTAQRSKPHAVSKSNRQQGAGGRSLLSRRQESRPSPAFQSETTENSWLCRTLNLKSKNQTAIHCSRLSRRGVFRRCWQLKLCVRQLGGRLMGRVKSNRVREKWAGAAPHWWAGTVCKASSDIRDTSTFCLIGTKTPTKSHADKHTEGGGQAGKTWKTEQKQLPGYSETCASHHVAHLIVLFLKKIRISISLSKWCMYSVCVLRVFSVLILISYFPYTQTHTVYTV